MLNVAIIEGGYSREEIISRKSALTIHKHIDRKKYTPYRVSIDDKGWFAFIDEQKMAIDKNDFSFIYDNQKITFDFAFIIIHGTPGEDGKLQAYFDIIGLKYNTSSSLVSMLTFNKYFCNRFLKTFGVSVAESFLVRKNERYSSKEIIENLGLPCFVKPADGGSSFGVTKVEMENELDEAIEKAMKHGSQVIIESFLKGREVTNGIYRNNEGYKKLPVTEIVTQNTFFDFEAKYKGESQEITPAPIDNVLYQKIQETTCNVAQILDLKGIARIDYIIVEDTPYLIEVNTIPGMSAESLIPQQAELENISIQELISEVIEVAI